MKKKNLRIVLMAAALLVVALILVFTRSNTTFRRQLSDFAVRDTAAVSRVVLADKSGKRIEIVRQESGLWILNDSLHAKQSMVNTFLETILKMRVREPVPLASHNNVVSRMAAQSVKTEVYQNAHRIHLFGLKLFPYEKKAKVIFVGDNTANNMGTHMLLENSSAPFVVHILGSKGFLNTRFSVLMEDWRDPSVFATTYQRIKSVQVTIPNNPEESFSIEKIAQREFVITPAVGKLDFEIDTIRVLRFLSSFSDLKFETIITRMEPLKKDSLLSSQPFILLAVTDDNNQTVRVKNFLKQPIEEEDFTGEKHELDPDRFYMLIEENNLLVLSQYYVFDKVMRPLSFFRKRNDQ